MALKFETLRNAALGTTITLFEDKVSTKKRAGKLVREIVEVEVRKFTKGRHTSRWYDTDTELDSAGEPFPTFTHRQVIAACEAATRYKRA